METYLTTVHYVSIIGFILAASIIPTFIAINIAIETKEYIVNILDIQSIQEAASQRSLQIAIDVLNNVQ